MICNTGFSEIEVKAENNKQSTLFSDLLDYFNGDTYNAYQAYLHSKTIQFKHWFDSIENKATDTNGEPHADFVVKSMFRTNALTMEEVLKQKFEKYVVTELGIEKQQQVVDDIINIVSLAILKDPKTTPITALYQAQKRFESIRDKAKTSEAHKDLANEMDIILTNWEKLIPKVIDSLQLRGVRTENIEFISEDSNYEKVKFNDDARFEINKQDTASANFKLFLSTLPLAEYNAETGVYVPVTNYYGARKLVDYKKAFQALLGLFADGVSDYNSMLEILKKEQDTNPIYASVYRVLTQAQISDKIKNEFVVALNSHYIEQTLLLYFKEPILDENNKRTNEYSWSFSVISANEKKAVDTVFNSWLANIKNSDLVTLNEKNQYIVNKEKIAEIKTRYKALLKQVDINTVEFKKDFLEILASLGIPLNANTLNYLYNNPKVLGANTIDKAFSLSSETKDYATSFMDKLFSSFTTEESGLIGINNPFVGKKAITFKNLAKVFYKTSDKYIVTGFRNSENSLIYAYNNNHFLSDTLRELKTNSTFQTDLSRMAFSANSTYLERIMNDDKSFIESLQLTYFDALKSGDVSTESTKSNKMGTRESMITALGLFMNSGKKQAVFFTPTHSDKSTRPLITVNRENLNFYITPNSEGKGNLTADFDITWDSDTESILLQPVNAEINRIFRFQNKGKFSETQIEGLHTHVNKNDTTSLQGGDLFYFHKYLNYSLLPKEYAEYKDIIYNQNEELNDTIEARNAIYSIVKQEVIKEIVKAKNLAIKYKMFENNVIDKNYKRNKNYDDNTALVLALADFIVNYRHFYSNYMQLIGGDPALHFTSKGGSLNAKINNALKNIQKRLAKDIAPGLQGSYAKTATYNAVVANDFVADSTTLSEYFDGAYKGMKVSDGQTITTVEEHLDNLYHFAKIEKETYDKIKKIINDNRGKYYELTPENTGLKASQIEGLFNPQKPVAVHTLFDYESETAVKWYEKSSSFPLLPQYTKGFAIDNLRIAMERENIARLPFASALKIGANVNKATLFDENNKLKSANDLAKELRKHTQIIPRNGFKIQQEVPYKKSNYIGTITQMNKLLFEGLSDKFNSLKSEKVDIKKELYDIAIQETIDLLGLDDAGNGDYIITNFEKLQKELIKEAKNRGWYYNDLEALELENGKFKIPIELTPVKEKAEALVLSIFKNKIIKQKLPGFALVQATSTGIYTAEDIDINDVNIVRLGNWNPSNGLRFVERTTVINEAGETVTTVTPAEILIPFKFKDNLGRLLNIKDYTNSDGTINTEKLPQELLELITARIPNQGHSSMLPVKIVGFLPSAMGDMVVVPQEIVQQMGSDFDVDKLYAYHTNYYINKDGVFTKYNENDFNSEEVEQKLTLLENELAEYRQELQEISLTIEDLKASLDAKLELLEENVREITLSTAISTLTDDKKKKYKELLNILNDYAILKKANKKTFLENRYIDIHKEVLLDEEVFDKLTAPLDKPYLADAATRLSKDQNDYSFLNPFQQQEDFSNNTAGKTGVGAFSLAMTFNALLQKTKMRKGYEDKDGNFVPQPIVIQGKNGIFYRLYEFGQVGQSIDNTDTITKKDLLVDAQSASVDNANTLLLHHLNLNDNTFSVYTALVLLNDAKGNIVSPEQITNFLRQPIIDSLLEKVKVFSDSTQEEANKSLAIEKAINELIIAITKKYDLAIPKEVFLANSDVLLEDYFASKKDRNTKEYAERQLNALLVFNDLHKLGNEIRRLMALTNVDSATAFSKDVDSLLVKESQKERSGTFQTLVDTDSIFTDEVITAFYGAVSLPLSVFKSLYPVMFSSSFLNSLESYAAEKDKSVSLLTTYERKKLHSSYISFLFANANNFGEAVTEQQETTEINDSNMYPFSSVEIHSKLGNKTESGNVRVVKNIFANKNNKDVITAFRVDKKLGLLESLKKYNAIGNPINWQDFKPRFEGDNATIAFIDWFLGKDYNNLEQDYRQEILNNLDNFKGKTIEYYKELNRPSHATALDYLINQKQQETTIASKTFSNSQRLEQINELFESNSELANIDTQEQYSQYLDTIFSDSKVKDIVYHGTDKEFDKFDTSKGKWSNAIFFSFKKGDYKRKKEILAIVNATNKFNIDSYIDKKYGQDTVKNIREERYSGEDSNPKATEEYYNLYAERHPDTDYEQFIKTETIKEYQKYGFDYLLPQGYLAVFEPEQIHILGSKQDIEGFREFTKSNNTLSSKNFNSDLLNTWENLSGNTYGNVKIVSSYTKSDLTWIADTFNKEVISGKDNKGRDLYRISVQKPIDIDSKSQRKTDVDTINQKRNKLLFNTKTNTSLGSRILQHQNKSWFSSSLFLQGLEVKIPDNVESPITINYRSAIDEASTDLAIAMDFIGLLVHENAEIRQLMNDLVDYMLITGVNKSFSTFMKYIPLEVLQEKSIVNNAETNINKNTSYIFLKQHFQHNPYEAYDITADVISDGSPISIGDKTFPMTQGFVLEESTTTPAFNFVRFSNKGKISLYEKTGTNEQGQIIYLPIDILGDSKIDLQEYNMNNPTQESVIPQNKAAKSPEGLTIPKLFFTDEQPTTQVANRAKKAVNLETYLGSDNEYKTIFEILSEIRHPFYTDLANYLLENFANSGIKVNIRIATEGELDVATEAQVKSTPTGYEIVFNPNHSSFNNPVEVERVILHEFLHVLTFHAVNGNDTSEYAKQFKTKINFVRTKFINSLSVKEKEKFERFEKFFKKDTELRKKLNNLEVGSSEYNKVEAELLANTDSISDLTTDEANFFYSFVNTDEFIVSVMTNKDFQKRLNNVSFNGDKNLLTRILDLVTDLLKSMGEALGITINKDSLLEASVNEIVNYLNQKSLDNESLSFDGSIYSKFAIPSTFSKTYGVFESIIEKLEFNIKSLQTARNKARLNQDGAAIGEYTSIIEKIENQIKSINKNKNISSVANVAQSHFEYIENILAKTNHNEVLLRRAQDLLTTWANLREFFPTVANDDLDRISNTVEKLQIQLNRAKKNLLLDKQEQVLTRPTKGQGTKRQELESLLYEDTDSNWFDANLRDLAQIDNPTAQYIAKILSHTNFIIRHEFNEFDKELNDLFSLVKKHNLDLDLMFRVNKDGEKTGQHTNRYSNLFFEERDRILRQFYSYKKNNPLSAYAKLKKELDKIQETIDVRFFILQGYSNKSYANVDEYTTYLEQKYGKETVNEIVNKVIKKINNYNTYLQSYKAGLTEQVTNNIITQQEADDKLKEYIISFNPVYYLELLEGKRSGTKDTNPQGFKYLVSVPNKTDNKGNSTGFYDERYLAIEQNPAYKEFYDRYVTILRTFVKYLPPSARGDLNKGMLPQVQKELTEYLANGGVSMMGGLLKNTVLNSITSDDIVEQVGTETDIYGVPVKRVKVRYNTKLESGNWSTDLEQILRKFGEMAISYRHKSLAEDRVQLAKEVLTNTKKITSTANKKGFIQKLRGGNVQDSRGLTNTLEAIDYGINAGIYDYRKDEHMVSKNKLYSINPYTDHKIAAKVAQLQAEMEELEDKNLQGTITIDEKIRLDEIIKELEANSGRNIVWGKVFDQLINYTQLKGMGLNVFSAISNIGFGLLGNFTWANGGVDFNTSQAWQAYKLMFNSTFKALTVGGATTETAQKIFNLIEKYDVLFEVRDSAYGENLMKKKFKVDAYFLQRNGEYFVQGMNMISVMLNTKVMVNGKETSLWDAYDTNGNLKDTSLESDWKVNISNDINKFTELRNKIVEINKKVHGNYDPDSPIRFKKHLLGRMLMQFRSWIPEGIATRFADERYNENLGRNVKGRYLTYAELGFANSVKMLGKQLIYSEAKNTFVNSKGEALSETDIENMRKNLAEVLLFLMLTTVALLLKATIDDDDEDKEKQYTYLLINQIMRVQSDVTFYLNPSTFESIIKNPLPVFKTYIDFQKAMIATKEYMFDDDYNEGKALNAWLRSFPYVNQKTRIEYMSSKIL